MCCRKGRRVYQAYDHMKTTLNAAMQDADTWTESMFPDRAHLQAAQGVVRSTFGLCMRKCEYLDRLPFLLARLGHDSVKARVLAQFAEADVSEHHAVTLHFLLPGSELRQQLDELPEGPYDLPNPLKRCQGV